VWNYTTGSEVYSSPAVANGTVYVGSSDSNVYALNASTGKLTWSFTTGDWVLSSPAVANGVVYVGSVDGNVYAIGSAAAATSQGTTPGFDVVLAFVGLVIAAYVARRKN
jgi:PGF-CTERM protein